jgi:hypothetical protein
VKETRIAETTAYVVGAGRCVVAHNTVASAEHIVCGAKAVVVCRRGLKEAEAQQTLAEINKRQANFAKLEHLVGKNDGELTDTFERALRAVVERDALECATVRISWAGVPGLPRFVRMLIQQDVQAAQ